MEVVSDLYAMPRTMRQLAVVQFFSWFAMFAMWIYGTPAVAEYHFAAPDPATRGYQDAADWWSLLGSVRNGLAAAAAWASSSSPPGSTAAAPRHQLLLGAAASPRCS